jgi:hypothetical protein
VWTDIILRDVKRLQGVWSATAGTYIHSHSELAPGVFETVYENGARIFVNYNNNEVQTNGVSIPAKDFIIR